MTDTEIIIAIAEACGWRAELWSSGGWQLYEPDGQRCSDGGHGTREAAFLRRCPDYLSDLNAMHEAEKVLTYEQFDEYYIQLAMRMVRPFHATARQRAEAFLRTIGRWKE